MVCADTADGAVSLGFVTALQTATRAEESDIRQPGRGVLVQFRYRFSATTPP
jgi:hypothetical protein